MKTISSLAKWFYLLYLPFMFAWMGVILFQINVLHYNPYRINEDFGAQFLLGYMMFMCALAFVVFYRSLEIKQVIVSDYRGSYEWIHTERSRFMFYVKLKYAWQGARVFYLFSQAQAWYIHKYLGINVFNWGTSWRTNMSFEYYDPIEDQVRWHSPYNNFR
jgi:hypothetical protein